MQACKQADGYQPSLVAPEKGMRQLASEALDHVEDPVNTTVQEVYNLLVNAGRCGMDSTCAPHMLDMEDIALRRGMDPSMMEDPLTMRCCTCGSLRELDACIHACMRGVMLGMHACAQGGRGEGGPVHGGRADGRDAHVRAQLQERGHASHHRRARRVEARGHQE